MAIMKKMG